METYFDLYILRYFNRKKETKLSQLVHILQGKRTPSMLYITEKNKWHHGFAKYPTIDRSSLKNVLSRFVQQNWLLENEERFLLTDLGEKAIKEYFETHYFPTQLTNFTNINVRIPFWNRFQLFTQVLSEKRYKNNYYTPIIKHPHHQENVRQLFQQFKNQEDVLLENWVKEQYFLFHLMEEKRINDLFSHLSGHQRIGETYNQVREKHFKSSLEYEFYHLDTLELLIQKIYVNKEKVPILYAILEQLHVETYYGLSNSTYHTYRLLKEGNTINEISKIRNLKVNTIREHVLEMAFILNDFPFRKFVPESTRSLLNNWMQTTEEISYKEARKLENTLEFMHFRLVELERMKRIDS